MRPLCVSKLKVVMHFGDFQLTIRREPVMICLLVLLAATRSHAADEKGASAAKQSTVVRPETKSARPPEQMAPDGLFNGSQGPNVPMTIPRPPAVQRTPAEQEKLDRSRNLFTQTPEEIFGILKLDDASSKNRTVLEKDSNGRSRDAVGRFPTDRSIGAADSMSIDLPRNRVTGRAASASADANRQGALPGEMDLEALLKRSSSVDRLGFGGGGLPPFWQGNLGFQVDATQREQREVRMNEFRQLFNSTAVQPASSSLSRSGLENPMADLLRNPSPRISAEPAGLVGAQTPPQDPRLRPGQAGVNHLPAPEVVGPRNPVTSPSSAAALDESNRERLTQQPTRLPFPKRVF